MSAAAQKITEYARNASMPWVRLDPGLLGEWGSHVKQLKGMVQSMRLLHNSTIS
jgi:hypothetical protein